MPPGLAIISQDDFGAGIFRGRKAPANSVYDAQDCLINDEGLLTARGEPVAYADPLDGPARIQSARLVGGWRTLTWGGLGSTDLVAFNGTTPTVITSVLAPSVHAKLVPVAGQLAWPSVLYAGALKADYSTGNAASTNGSKTITGSGTLWSANADAGMYLSIGGTYVGIVASVDNNAQITLWHTAKATIASGPYTLTRVRTVSTPGSPVCAVGSPARLINALENRAYFSEPGDPATIPEDQYWEFSPDAEITAGESIKDTAVLFTHDGVWTISGMNLDPLDPLGNAQHTVQQINKELTVWAPRGIAGWSGALIVPAEHDIVLLTLDGAAEPISGPIRPLYRAIDKGLIAGTGIVHRGHYLLAVENGVQTIVCRLDRGFAWTRWIGIAKDHTLTVNANEGTQLLSVNGLGAGISDSTGCLEPGSTPVTVITNDFDTGPGPRPANVVQARLVYEATEGADVSVSWAAGPEDASFTACALVKGGADSDGTGYSVWAINKARDRIRLKISQPEEEEFLLREVELLVRQGGRA